jgi:hypothetical protein
VALTTLALLLGALHWAGLAATPVAQAAPSQPAAGCADVTAVPSTECQALVALFGATTGPGWDDRSGWGTFGASAPCDWYGVECVGGHITGLLLESNRLSGTLPVALTTLPSLQRLRLADNLLRGEAPPAICNLVDTVTDASFDYNQLSGGSAQARQCMTRLDPNWAATQTVPPRSLQVTGITSTSVTLAWTPIAYTGDGGYYEIGASATPGGPYSSHGVTAGRSATGYVVDGLAPGKPVFLRVRSVTPAHGNQENEQVSAGVGVAATTLAADGAKALVLIYFPADNDLSPYVPGVLERVRRGTEVNPNVQVLFLADRLGDNNTGLFEIAEGAVVSSTALLAEWGKNELDTTDPAVLSWFLRYGRATFPAATTVVSLMGHGIGLMPEFAWLVAPAPGEAPAPQPGIPALPRGLEATPGDVGDNRGYMSTPDFGKALAEATDNGANPFDLVFFDQCFQGNLDVIYEVRSSAKVFVASPNYAWLSAPYAQYLTVFAPNALPDAIAQAMVRIYETSLNNRHPNAIFWVRGADIPAIAQAAGNLAGALRAALAGGRAAEIAGAAADALYVDTTQCGAATFELGPPDELLGAGSFARRLRDGFPVGDAHGVHAAAEALLTALDQVTTLARTGSPYIAPDETWDYRDSLTLLAPLRRDAPANVAWRASIYRATAPLTAVWSPAPEQTVQISATFAFVRDHAWDEFLAEWYTAPLTPTLGEWCQYIPPVVAADEVSETLTLTAAPGAAGVLLSWTPTTFDDATSYWVLTRRPRDVSWVVLDALPIAQTGYTAPFPKAGETDEYTVVAQQDDLGVTLAEANTVSYTMPPDPARNYLPLVSSD